MEHEPAAEGLSVPDNWPDVLALLQVHEERFYGKGVINGLIRMYQVMAKARANAVIRTMTAPNTGEYPTFDGVLQIPEYTWGLMCGPHRANEQNAKEGAALRLGRQRLLHAAGVRWEFILNQQSLETPPWLGRAAMRKQLNFILETADDPKTDLRLLPEEVPEELPDVTLIYLEGKESPRRRYGFTVANPYFAELMVDSQSGVPTLERYWNQAWKNSLSVEDSRDLIAEKAQALSDTGEDSIKV